MSTLEERRAAQAKAKRLLEMLAFADNESGIPDSVRMRAQEVLRHFPAPQDVVDVLTVLHEYVNLMAQADAGQAFGLEMGERAKEAAQRAEDMKSWLVIATSLSVAVAFAVSAAFTAAYVGAIGNAIWLGLGSLVSGAFAAITAVAWRRACRKTSFLGARP